MKLNIQLFAEAQGKVIIDMELNTKDIDKKLESFVKAGEKKQIEIELKLQKADETRKTLQDNKKELEEMDKKYGDILEKQIKYREMLFKASEIVSGTEYEGDPFGDASAVSLMADAGNEKAKQLENDMAKLAGEIFKAENKMGVDADKLLEKYEGILSANESLESVLTEQTKDIANINNEYVEIINKAKEYKQELRDKEVKDFFQNQSKGITGIITKIGKWALAIFSIRSAYLFIRRITSTIAQTDDGLKAKLDYITYALANAVKPIIEWIINAVYKILGIIGATVKIITGKNIFKKSGVEDFKKSLSQSNKSAKELKKTLAGFDEMNILNEDGSVGALGGYSSNLGDLPDLADMVEQYEPIVKDWGKNIKKWFYGGDYDNFGDAFVGNIKQFPSNLKKMFDPVNTIVKNTVINPLLQQFNSIKEATRPLWEPMVNELKKGYNQVIKPTFEQMKPLLEPVKNAWSRTLTNIKGVFKPFTESIKKMINNTFGIFGVHLKTAETSTSKATEKIKNDMRNFLNKIIDWINQTFGVFGVHIDRLEDDINELPDEVQTAINEIAQKDIPPKQMMFELSLTMNTTNAETSLSGFVSRIGTKLQNSLNGVNFNQLAEKLANLLAKFPGVSVTSAKKMFGLAKGGIVNMPGRGIPYAGALIGEQRPEGIVPLTDTQQMALLGEAIGKFVRIDNVIDVNMDSRKIKRIMATSDDRNRMAGNGYVR